jgi:hypothetical protein
MHASQSKAQTFRSSCVRDGSIYAPWLRARDHTTTWCQIEAEGAIWYQFGTKEGERNSQPGTEIAQLWKFVENLRRKERMKGERVAAAKLH